MSKIDTINKRFFKIPNVNVIIQLMKQLAVNHLQFTL